ncbi:MAG: HEPN domain-containing protein [Clostridia bacterium]|nr:HEPN domain-containing protein [Clostridia bacterium]
MRRKSRDEALRWLRQAEYDLDDAKFKADGKRYNVACFLCQQAAEKALKAYLISIGGDPWGHSVAELVERVARPFCGAGP